MSLRFIVGLCFFANFLAAERAAAQNPAGGAKPGPAPPAASAAPSAKAEDRAAQGDRPRTWSDPRIIAELVKNCHFDVSRDRPTWAGGGAGETDPLMCLSGRAQSCVPDPCFSDYNDEGCRARCETTCKACAQGCGGQCESCKARCTDDTCRTNCAKQCASCREGCVRAVDRCGSGKCSAEYEQCRLRYKAAWVRNGCARVCARVLGACSAKCRRQHPNDAMEAGICSEKCSDNAKPPAGSGCDFPSCSSSPDGS